jgi:hypothetical protein
MAAQTKATTQTDILEKALHDAKSNGLAKPILDAMAAELAKSKDSRPKANKPAQSNGARLTQLQRRLQVADTAASNALERHQKQIGSLEQEIKQLTAIRDYKIQDFAETQKACARRVGEDKQAVSELMADLGTLVQEPQEATGATVEEIADPTDLTIFFAAKAIDAVNVDGNFLVAQVPATEEVRCMLGNALAFFQAWPSHLPKSPTTFRCIGMRPCDVHTCIGSQIWEACWGSRHGNIHCDQYIPYQLLNLLAELLPHAHATVQSAEFSVQGAAMYQKVAATAHRKLMA